MKYLSLLLLATVLLLAFRPAADDRKPTIFLVGDSTMSEKPLTSPSAAGACISASISMRA